MHGTPLGALALDPNGWQALTVGRRTSNREHRQDRKRNPTRAQRQAQAQRRRVRRSQRA